MKYFSVLYIVFMFVLSCKLSGQIIPKSLVTSEHEFLVAKFDNPLRIVAQQEKPVALSQLSASLRLFTSPQSVKQELEIVESNGFFIIHPDTSGYVEIVIRLEDTIEVKRLIAKPMVAVGRLGFWKANSEENMTDYELKCQRGIIASVECCGFDAKCKVLGYEVLRIDRQNNVRRSVNVGEYFEPAVKTLILAAESKDIFIFRNIRYLCPGSGKTQRLDDMILELK